MFLCLRRTLKPKSELFNDLCRKDTESTARRVQRKQTNLRFFLRFLLLCINTVPHGAVDRQMKLVSQDYEEANELSGLVREIGTVERLIGAFHR